MSVLIYRDGVMAADTAAFAGDFICSLKNRKILRLPNGLVVGCAGRAGYTDRFFEWARNDLREELAPPPAPNDEDLGAIVVGADGKVYEYGHDLVQMEVTDAIVVSVGVAHDFALALATLGWSAPDIVRHAIKHCVWAGGDILVVDTRRQTEEVIVIEPDAEPVELPDEPLLAVDGVMDEDPPRRMSEGPLDAEVAAFLKERGLD